MSKNKKTITEVYNTDIFKTAFYDTVEFVHTVINQIENIELYPKLLENVPNYYNQYKHIQGVDHWIYRFIAYLFIVRPKTTNELLMRLDSLFPDMETYIKNESQRNAYVLNPYDVYKYPEQTIWEYIQKDEVRKIHELVNYQRENLQNSQIAFHQNLNVFECYNNGVIVTPLLNEPVINIAAFYGSCKIFKYCIMNACKVTPTTDQFAVAGGNMEIIKILQNTKSKFEGCIKTSVLYNRFFLTNFLIAYYEHEDVPLALCANAFNYDAFLYFTLYPTLAVDSLDMLSIILTNSAWNIQTCPMKNKIIQYIINKGIPLQSIMKNYILDACLTHDMKSISKNKEISYIINIADAIFDPDSKLFLTRTPLAAACKNKDITVDDIKFFINNGADVNKGLITPLYAICSNGSPNLEIIHFLILSGANPKKGIYNPLCPLVENNEFEAIKFLIQNGADVNKPSLLYPIQYALIQDEVNLDILKILLENGAQNEKIYFYENMTEEMQEKMLKNISSNRNIGQLISKHPPSSIISTDIFQDHSPKNIYEFFETFPAHKLKYFLKDSSIFQHLADVKPEDRTPLASHKIFSYLHSNYNLPTNFTMSIIDAIKEANFQSVEFLVHQSVDLNKQYFYDIDNTWIKGSLIYLAISYKHMDIAKLLLESGANPRNTDDQTITEFLQLYGIYE